MQQTCHRKWTLPFGLTLLSCALVMALGLAMAHHRPCAIAPGQAQQPADLLMEQDLLPAWKLFPVLEPLMANSSV